MKDKFCDVHKLSRGLPRAEDDIVEAMKVTADIVDRVHPIIVDFHPDITKDQVSHIVVETLFQLSRMAIELGVITTEYLGDLDLRPKH